jgi:protein-S-isoprenylcysteine O-methyltransferase Ste14
MTEQTNRKQRFSIIINLLTFLLLLIMPLLAGGDWSWRLGWLYTGLMVFFFIVSRAIAIRLHPGFARERATASTLPDTKSWDKWIVPLVALYLPLLVLLIAGLDHRLGWTSLPSWAHWLGLALNIFGYAVGSWAMAVNAFFSSQVRIQTDRGHHVISAGPYAIVRHPAYATGLVAMFGIPLLLDSWWAFLPLPLLCIALILRTALEDKTLHTELPGYPEYAAKVRYRLVPGIW